MVPGNLPTYNTPMKLSSRILKQFGWLCIAGFITCLVIGGVAFIYLESKLPDVASLKDTHLQVPLRIYSRDQKLIAEYGEKRRIPVSIQQIPPHLIQAILATEDQRFFDHPGVDPRGLARAAVQLIRTGKKSQGGSTITMQVARNYFLSRKKTFGRKIQEILLAIKIDHLFTKEKILELYLNKIFLGHRAYGVAAAAQVYYGKAINQLNLAQLAMIAGLPKAPSSLNPITNPDAALARRNHVLARMLTENYITQEEYRDAVNTPLSAKYHDRTIEVHAAYVAEMIRQNLLQQFGKAAYTRGFQVYTTLDAKKQNAAHRAIQKHLIAYDKRHGYRGPMKHIDLSLITELPDWTTPLQKISTIAKMIPAIILEVHEQDAVALLKSGQTVKLELKQLQWARPRVDDRYLGPKPKSMQDVFKPGDVIRVSKNHDSYELAQVPEVEGAFIALDPNNGAIRAIVGGFSFRHSKFNRAIQAQRQPGSSFKPFIYTAALAKGYTLASLINDAPIVINDPTQENLWRPQNDTRKFYGPTRLRTGLIRSRNLVSIRLLRAIGISYTLDYIQRFGFKPENLPKSLSLALGSGSITPLELTRGYAVFANGGFQIDPYMIDSIQDAKGNVLFQTTPITVPDNPASDTITQNDPNAAPKKLANRVLSPQITYLMNVALKDVIQHGTGRAARILKRSDIAGKTGTTNDQVDAWFAGFNTNLVATAWVGFDKPKSLYEYGAQAALPIWIDFMKQALARQPNGSMKRPNGLITLRINAKSGQPSSANDPQAIFETFRQQYAPKQPQQDNPQDSDSDDDNDNNALRELF